MAAQKALSFRGAEPALGPGCPHFQFRAFPATAVALEMCTPQSIPERKGVLASPHSHSAGAAPGPFALSTVFHSLARLQKGGGNLGREVTALGMTPLVEGPPTEPQDRERRDGGTRSADKPPAHAHSAPQVFFEGGRERAEACQSGKVHPG